MEFDEQKELVNDLIFLNKLKDDLYQYHPSNPQGLNVEEEYNKVINIIEEIEEKLL